MLCLILSVIKAAGAPCRVVSLPAIIEVKSLLSVKEAQALSLIVDRVRMNDIHHHGDAKSMSLVNQSLELLRSTETRAESKEIRHLITERSVIWMFLKGHDLKGVIAKIRDSRKNICAELLECSHLLLLGRHTDMALINERMRTLARSLMLPLIRLRVPYLRAELFGHRVLNRAGGICRKSLRTSTRPFYI